MGSVVRSWWVCSEHLPSAEAEQTYKFSGNLVMDRCAGAAVHQRSITRLSADSIATVVCHTSLCHIPGPERVVAEAARVAADDGWPAVFDVDYATTTVATSATDPLQACADATIEALVHDPFLVRRLAALVCEAGWTLVRVRSHG